MATESNITKDDHWFTGTDYTFRYTVYADEEQTTIKDVSGFAMSWVLRPSDFSADPASLTKTTLGGAITVTGTFNSTPASNTQKVLVQIADSDTESLTPLTYRYSLKRTDDGSETILAFGKAVLRQTTAR